jgi:hypothetical protein
MNMPTPTRRRWFRFSLRTMFVVVTVVAIFVAYHVNWIRQRHEFLKTEVATFPSQSRPSAPGLLWMFGEKGVPNLTVLHPADFVTAESLFPEATLDRILTGHGREIPQIELEE